jgi:hypothetical protein
MDQSFLLVIAVGFLYLQKIYDQKLFKKFSNKTNALIKCARYETLLTNIRSGYGILNRTTIHYWND